PFTFIKAVCGHPRTGVPTFWFTIYSELRHCYPRHCEPTHVGVAIRFSFLMAVGTPLRGVRKKYIAKQKSIAEKYR
ncbi:MAG: hypothetical protein IIX84_02675, partial [Oscillospiraceae bacterium]|nr:hypothetical protein [Oscillospiraceae bacterium]